MNTDATDTALERLVDLSDDDAATLRALVRQLDPDVRFDAEALRQAIRRGTTSVFVFRHQSAIVASATAVRFTTPTGNHCRIEDVVVDERFRGQGLGRRIMSDLMDALRSQGVQSVELTSRPSRVAANALYQALGFNRRQTNVYARQV